MYEQWEIDYCYGREKVQKQNPKNYEVNFCREACGRKEWFCSQWCDALQILKEFSRRGSLQILTSQFLSQWYAALQSDLYLSPSPTPQCDFLKSGPLYQEGLPDQYYWICEVMKETGQDFFISTLFHFARYWNKFWKSSQKIELSKCLALNFVIIGLKIWTNSQMLRKLECNGSTIFKVVLER